jgi:hypothetical protein
MEYILSAIIAILGLYVLLTNRSNILCLFVISRILIPETVGFFNSPLSINSFVVLLMITAIALNGKICITADSKHYIKITSLFLIYFLLSLVMSNYLDLFSQYGYLFEFAFTQLLPGLLASLLLINQKQVAIFNKTLLICTSIACIYGVITFLARRNPYVENLTGNILETSSWKGYSTSATFSTTTTYGYFLTIIVPYIIWLIAQRSDKRKKNLEYFALVLSIIGIFLCRKRSAFITIAFDVLVLLFILPNSKKYFYRAIGCVTAFLIFAFATSQIPGLQNLYNYIKASLLFFNDNAVQVSNGELGSTMALRLRQLTYPFTEISNNPLFGHGFGWCSEYLSKFKLHPVLFGFESIFALGICELGILFFVLYPLMYYLMLKYYINYKTNKNKLIILFFVSYIFNTIASGFNYFFLFVLLTVLIKKSISVGNTND